MRPNPDPATILADLRARLPDTVAVDAWGETSLFYNPGMVLPRGVYFATLKHKDGANDSASNLDREGVFRLNLGVPRAHFVERFGPPPPRPGKGQTIEGGWTFTTLDTLTPHPVYGWMSWVAVLNPSWETLGEMDDMIEASFRKAKAAFAKRAP